MLNKEKIKKHFSQSAANYDAAALLQRKTALSLLKRISLASRAVNNILDVGTGTGFMALDLQKKFKGAKILACDLAPGMIAVAKTKSSSISFTVADAENLPYASERFELVVSNLSFQWMNIVRVLKEIFRVLKKGGSLYFSTLGPKTLKELREIFPSSVIEFQPENKIKAGLVKNKFSAVKMDSVLETEYYPNVKELMLSLKNIGAQNITAAPTGLGSTKSFRQKMEIYNQKFRQNNAVFASFDVIFGQGRKEEE